MRIQLAAGWIAFERSALDELQSEKIANLRAMEEQGMGYKTRTCTRKRPCASPNHLEVATNQQKEGRLRAREHAKSMAGLEIEAFRIPR